MKPTLLVGGDLWSTYAWIHSIALASPHIGSGPGVSGLSAMHVKPLVPLRTTRTLPSLPIAMTVEFFATASGAADIALLMISSSLIGVIAPCCCACEDVVTAAMSRPAAQVATPVRAVLMRP